MDANELKLSPEALQTGLMRRWRAELATNFVADVVSLAEYVAARNAQRPRNHPGTSRVNAELMRDDLDRDTIGIEPCNALAL
jgi:hypothetical protein